MAERDNNFDFPMRYDWAAWFNGETWRLSKGEDFSVSVPVFRSMAYRAAAARRGSLLTTIDGDDLVVRFTPRKKKAPAAIKPPTPHTPN